MKPACSAVPQLTAPSPTPPQYQKNMKYLKQVGNKREGQRLYTELRFEKVNHIMLKVKLKILYVNVKTLHIEVSFIQQGQPCHSHNFKYPMYHPQTINSYITVQIKS
jgi:hypothetical protein